MIYCVNKETMKHPIPEVIPKAASHLSGRASFGVINCWEPNPESNRTLADRFKFRSSPPVSFAVANGNKPVMLSLVGVSKPEQLEKSIKHLLDAPVSSKVDTLKKWSSLCTSRKSCVVVGHKNPAQRDTVLTMIKPLLSQHRMVKVVTVDTAFWQVKLDKALTETRGKRTEKRAEVICLHRTPTGELGKKSGANRTGAFLKELDASEMEAFFGRCGRGEDLTAMKSAPTIKARPTKKPPFHRCATSSARPAERPVAPFQEARWQEAQRGQPQFWREFRTETGLGGLAQQHGSRGGGDHRVRRGGCGG